MNNIVLQSGGFPLTTKTFEFMQQAYQGAISALSALGGTTYILSGVEVADGNVSAGFIVYNGEVLPFNASAEHGTVSIIETIELLPYNEDINPADGNLDEKDGLVTRHAVCGDVAGAVAQFDFSDLKPAFFNFLGKYFSDVVLPYTGTEANIPKGFALCNGENGTPDMRGAFLVGYDPDDEDYGTVGNQGGTKEVILSEAQMPQHYHNGNTNFAGAHSHTFTQEDTRGTGSDGAEDGASSFSTENTSVAGQHTHTLTTDQKGGNQPHENRPPYYTVAYMKFVG